LYTERLNRSGLEHLDHVWSKTLRSSRGRVTSHVLKLAFEITLAPFVNRLDIPGAVHDSLEKHWLITQLAGWTTNNIRRVRKKLAELFAAQCALGIAGRENDVMYASCVRFANQSREISRGVTWSFCAWLDQVLMRIKCKASIG